MSKKIKLNLDFDTLFPGKSYKIQDQEIFITPVNIQQLAYVIKKVKDVIPIIQSHKITFKNFNTFDNILTLTSVLFDNAPEILSEVLGVELESLKQLPLEIIVEMLAIAIEVNLESKESLEKNYQVLKASLQKIKI